MLGGPDRQTLFIVAREWHGMTNVDAGAGSGQIVALRARAAGADCPGDDSLAFMAAREHASIDLDGALHELQRRHAEIDAGPGELRGGLDLTAFELRSYSQNGEDGVLAEILRRIGAPSRYFVEFGAGPGDEGNCVLLAVVAGWQGLLIESDVAEYEELRRRYAGQNRVKTIHALVTSANVESLFAGAHVPRGPDVLSIDVDGADYWIWEAMDTFRPRVVVIEYNGGIDPQRRLVQPRAYAGGWDRTQYYGASLASMRHLAEQKRYRLVHTDLSGTNAFFVRSDLAGRAFIPPWCVTQRVIPDSPQGADRPRPPRPGSQYFDLDTGQMVEAEQVTVIECVSP